MSYVLLFIFGQTFLKSAGTRKIPGIFVNITSLIIYAVYGIINYLVGFIMAIGGFIGAYIASKYSDKIGNVWLKRGFIIIVSIIAIKLLIG